MCLLWNCQVRSRGVVVLFVNFGPSLWPEVGWGFTAQHLGVEHVLTLDWQHFHGNNRWVRGVHHGIMNTSFITHVPERETSLIVDRETAAIACMDCDARITSNKSDAEPETMSKDLGSNASLSRGCGVPIVNILCLISPTYRFSLDLHVGLHLAAIHS